MDQGRVTLLLYTNWENSVRAGTTTGSVREKQSAATNDSENTA